MILAVYFVSDNKISFLCEDFNHQKYIYVVCVVEYICTFSCIYILFSLIHQIWRKATAALRPYTYGALQNLYCARGSASFIFNFMCLALRRLSYRISEKEDLNYASVARALIYIYKNM